MAKQKNEILHLPPVDFQLSVLDENNKTKAAPTWQRFFTNLHAVVSQFFPTVTAQDSDGITHSSIPRAATYTTAERDALQSVPNGSFLYNTTTQKFNFRENGTWKELS